MSVRQSFLPTRRALLAGGGSLIVAFSLPGHGFAQEGDSTQDKAPPPKVAPPLPGSLKQTPMLDGWIRIDAQGRITVMTGKCELGQGAKTALLQLAAEQLRVDMKAITLITADTRSTPNEGFTAGSHTMMDSGTAIVNAAAQVRALLIGIAADKLGVARDQLDAQDGMVKARDGRSASYADLVTGLDLHVAAQPTSDLGAHETYKYVGKSIQRVDIPAKVTGGVAYIQDMRLDGMVHGRVVRAPSYGAVLSGVDTSAVEKMPGVLKVVRDGSYLAVIAEREYQAIKAMEALRDAAQWNEHASIPPPEKTFEHLAQSKATDRPVMDRQGASAPAVKTVTADYLRDYQMHVSIGPSCGIAQSDGDRLTVWSHAQGMFPLRLAIAQMVGLPNDHVDCIHVEGAGCYGHNGADDAAADAALLARAFPGRAVRVQWMREQEHMWEPKGSAMMVHVEAGLDSAGTIVDWRYEVRSNTHSTRPPGAGQLMPAWFLEKAFQPDPPQPVPLPEGDGDRNSQPLYTFANVHVVYHFVPEMPVRVSALRGLGAYMNVFSIETFMDDLAQATGVDPVEFRLKHLQDDRARAVIERAAKEFGWSKDAPRRPNVGRGFAFARYKNIGAYAAVALELSVDPELGRVQLHRAEVAVDSGEAINPDGIRNQIEGGLIQSASWTLYESVSHDETRILSTDWSTYPILRFRALPEAVRVHVIDRPGQPFLGTGEATQGPTSAAIGNAIRDATGLRLRHLPLTADRIRAARSV